MHYHWDLAMVLADTDRWWHGIGITLLYSVATVAGGIVIGVFCTEIVRAGVMSIGRGQWQAGRAVGMTYAQLMRRIVLPQAVRRMIPPLVNQSITQLKNTALLYVVAVPDLMYTSSIITAETYRPLEVYTSAAAIYFLMLYPLTLFAKRLETRVDR